MRNVVNADSHLAPVLAESELAEAVKEQAVEVFQKVAAAMEIPKKWAAVQKSLKPCAECGEVIRLRYYAGCIDPSHGYVVVCPTAEQAAEMWNKKVESWNGSTYGARTVPPPPKPRSHINFKEARSLAKAGKTVRREKTKRGLYITSNGTISLFTKFPTGKENLRLSDEDIDATDWYVEEDMR